MPLHAKFPARLTISIDPSVKLEIKEMAQQEERSEADIVREALSEYLRNRGPKQKSPSADVS